MIDINQEIKKIHQQLDGVLISQTYVLERKVDLILIVLEEIQQGYIEHPRYNSEKEME